MAENCISNLEDVKEFRGLGLSFDEKLSDNNKYIFLI